MLSFNEILQRIEAEIKRLRFDCPPAGLYAPIEYILSLGGKRIRPAFVLSACNLYSDDIEEAVKPALSLEVFHNFTLLHDDLMDGADRRRGKPTVHTLWNDNTAILSGDAMLIVAYQLISASGSRYLKALLDLFTATALEICGGQQYDMEFESLTDVTEADYIEMIRLKTAVLLACGLKMGAIAGDAPAEDADHLYRYGINIGLAFQLKDDLLDVYGDPATFGKNIGGDIVCNKKTFLLVNALRRADGRQKEELIRWLDAKTIDPQQKIKAFRALYDRLQLRELTESKIRYFYHEALSHLTQLHVAEERLVVLNGVSDSLLYRQS
ncbi:MAG: polyprenyl synthetase family protein [Tannerellaceae bacterium]|jgi:geranylgeranyl diphosphate synthase type II|nr:polyprenyl synthetase family protein [Tannerellaceae bacterium]